MWQRSAIRLTFPIGRARRAALAAVAAVGAVLLACASSSPAAADFRLCNNTSGRVGVAIGYRDSEGWATEGWWNLQSRSCETLLRGALVARYYYVYAVDYDRGGEWAGQAFMCTRDKEFTIRGVEDCLARGFDRTGFFEVDTGDQQAWTVQLTDTADPTVQRPPNAPFTTIPPAPGRPSVTAPQPPGESPAR